MDATHATPTAEQAHTVTDDDTAAAVGSGSLPVLGTPRLLAWCEAVTCAVAEQAGLEDGRTTVGTRLLVEHLAASPVGATVRVRARLTAREGRRLAFAVEARHDDDTVVATGTVDRADVDAERFLARLA